MDIVEAIKQRKSIRAFKPDPVPLDVLKQIMELALLKQPAGLRQALTVNPGNSP